MATGISLGKLFFFSQRLKLIRNVRYATLFLTHANVRGLWVYLCSILVKTCLLYIL